MKFLTRKSLGFSQQPHFSSASYWEERYLKGGNSGAGSFGNLAQFKAEVINGIIAAQGIESGLEFGCGDGNNLALYLFKQYTGVDISEAALTICREKYRDDASKRFLHYAQSPSEKAEMTLSLDVIYHLVEDTVYFEYLDRLFSCSNRFVLIYSTCVNYRSRSPHVRHRNFLRRVSERWPQWHVTDVIANRYPVIDIAVEQPGFSPADFYLFSQEK